MHRNFSIAPDFRHGQGVIPGQFPARPGNIFLNNLWPEDTEATSAKVLREFQWPIEPDAYPTWTPPQRVLLVDHGPAAPHRGRYRYRKENDYALGMKNSMSIAGPSKSQAGPVDPARGLKAITTSKYFESDSASDPDSDAGAASLGGRFKSGESGFLNLLELAQICQSSICQRHGGLMMVDREE